MRKFTRMAEPKPVIPLEGDANAKAQFWHLSLNSESAKFPGLVHTKLRNAVACKLQNTADFKYVT